MDDASDPDRSAAGAVYDWYQEGCRRLQRGNARGAAEILELAVEREPGKASLREVLARAYFATSRVRLARDEFCEALALDPTDDYAHFGVGRCHERLGDLAAAAKYFRLACAMAPKPDYQDALNRVETRLS
jgi:Tfp pilus assembly protein PilF